MNDPWPKTEIAGVLMHDDGKNGISPEISVGGIGIVGAKPLGVAFDALPVGRMAILRLADARRDGGESEDIDIGRALPHQLHFLAGVSGGTVPS